MPKINILQFEDGKIGLATEGLTISVNNQKPVTTTETEVEVNDQLLENPDQFKEKE